VDTSTCPIKVHTRSQSKPKLQKHPKKTAKVSYIRTQKAKAKEELQRDKREAAILRPNESRGRIPT